jgi:hypothetical protein
MKLAAKDHHPKTTISPQNHHQFTTKNHPEKRTLPATPLKNASKTTKPRLIPGLLFSKPNIAKKPSLP